MNKQELIDYCNAIKENKSQIINCIDVNGIIKKIEQLDESKKVTVPQFVADWIFKAQLVERLSLRSAIKNGIINLYFKESQKVIEWLGNDENQETFARAWLDGYDIEKEKRYRVKLKILNDYLNETETGLHFYNDYKNNKTFTKKELEESGLGWVFGCEGIEIEEIEQ